MMEAYPVLLPLLVKIAAAALVVVLASIASEKAGPFLGGVISTLPVSTGPAYVLLAIEHDDRFIADSALSSLVTNGAMILFLATLVRAAPRLPTAPAIAAATAVWLGLAVSLRALGEWSIQAALLVNIAAYTLAALMALPRGEAAPPPRRAAARWYDIPARAVLVGLLVAAVATASHVIGPAATGIAAIYPIALTSLAIILHRRLGGDAVAAAMRSALLTNPGFALCLLTAHLTAEPLGRAWALGLALAVSLAWAGGLLVVRSRRSPPPAPTQ